MGRRPPVRKTGPETHRIIHVSHRDLEMHYYLARKRGKREPLPLHTHIYLHRGSTSVSDTFADCGTAPTLDMPMDWNKQIVEVEHRHLLHYCAPATSPLIHRPTCVD